MEKLETLKKFPSHLPESDLKEKKGLALFFAERVVCKANMIWDEKGWTATDVEEMRHTNMRKTNNSKTENLDLFNPHFAKLQDLSSKATRQPYTKNKEII